MVLKHSLIKNSFNLSVTMLLFHLLDPYKKGIIYISKVIPLPIFRCYTPKRQVTVERIASHVALCLIIFY